MKLDISKSVQIDLDPLPLQFSSTDTGRHLGVSGSEQSPRLARLVNAAVRSQFEMPGPGKMGMDQATVAKADRIRPALFRDRASGLVRLVYKEIVLRFAPKGSARQQKAILESVGLVQRGKSRHEAQRIVAHDPSRKIIAEGLIDVSNKLNAMPEVAYASPNFVSEFVRVAAIPAVVSEQWHLTHAAGSVRGSDVDIVGAWPSTLGKPRIVIAVLYDGVDVDHKNLRKNILRGFDTEEPRDLHGRDFFISDDEHPDHFDPRPKLFQFPYDEMAGNDIHGTPCAGVVAARGDVGGILGAAPRCRILPVKVFHADNLASDARVADAIAYAGRFADVLSCSWSGPTSAIIEQAIARLATGDDGLKRGKLGTPVLAASGNGHNGVALNAIAYPASSPHAICVGATTDRAAIAGYSNFGPQMFISAPSNGGNKSITTTDVSIANRGFNVDTVAVGGEDGLHTNSFGGTSSATPLAAGIVGLILSARPDLTLDQVRTVLKQSADKIGSPADYTDGRSQKYGFGRINAAAAVAVAKALPVATS